MLDQTNMYTIRFWLDLELQTEIVNCTMTKSGSVGRYTLKLLVLNFLNCAKEMKVWVFSLGPSIIMYNIFNPCNEYWQMRELPIERTVHRSADHVVLRWALALLRTASGDAEKHKIQFN